MNQWLPVVGGEGDAGGEDGEGCDGGGEDVEQVTGATSCGARTGHGWVLTWSDLRSSHHHQHDATETEADTTTTICVLQSTVSNYQSLVLQDTHHSKCSRHQPPLQITQQ